MMIDPLIKIVMYISIVICAYFAGVDEGIRKNVMKNCPYHNRQANGKESEVDND